MELKEKVRIHVARNELTCINCGQTVIDRGGRVRCPLCDDDDEMFGKGEFVPTLSYLNDDDYVLV